MLNFIAAGILMSLGRSTMSAGDTLTAKIGHSAPQFTPDLHRHGKVASGTVPASLAVLPWRRGGRRPYGDGTARDDRCLRELEA